MKYIRSKFPLVLIAAALVTFQACKTKKLVQKSTPVVTETDKPAPVAPTPPPAPAPTPPAPAPQPNYNFTNIQFEFNSGVLKTSSYPALDNAAAQMKMDPSAKFMLKGYASAEGTAAHNMELSVDRANAVKAYLVNSGVTTDNITAQGYGESNPVADNTTEDGRVLNRRVEISKQN